MHFSTQWTKFFPPTSPTGKELEAAASRLRGRILDYLRTSDPLADTTVFPEIRRLLGMCGEPALYGVSVSAFLKAYANGDVEAFKAAAAKQGYQVIP